MLEALAKDHLVDAVHDHEIRLRIDRVDKRHYDMRQKLLSSYNRLRWLTKEDHGTCVKFDWKILKVLYQQRVVLGMAWWTNLKN